MHEYTVDIRNKKPGAIGFQNEIHLTRNHFLQIFITEDIGVTSRSLFGIIGG